MPSLVTAHQSDIISRREKHENMLKIYYLNVSSVNVCSLKGNRKPISTSLFSTLAFVWRMWAAVHLWGIF